MSAQNRSNISDFYTNGNPQAGDRAFAAESWNLETAFNKRLITEDELKNWTARNEIPERILDC